MGIGTKTAFSGLGKTPTGELHNVSGEMATRRKQGSYLTYALTPASSPNSVPVFSVI